MSNRRRAKRRHGCAGWVVTLLIIVLIGVILISTGVISKLSLQAEKYMYPLSYEQVILDAADKYNLEPEFICAVIHTESEFDPSAESHAGARGLMQIMPETFRWLCSIRNDDRDPEDITDPVINIDYGTYYLRTLIDKYDDEYTAAAAYNAGNVVSEWLQNPEYSSDGVTLSKIPYRETSQYVERIKIAEKKYQKLYFDE